jgi:hypothetical protein
VVDGVEAARGLDVMTSGADPTLENASAFMPEGHAEIIKVPKDQAQGA